MSTCRVNYQVPEPLCCWLWSACWRSVPAIGKPGPSAKRSSAIKPGQVHQAEQLSAAFRHAAEVAMPSVVTVHSKIKGHVAKHIKANPHSKRDSTAAKIPSKGRRSRISLAATRFRHA